MATLSLLPSFPPSAALFFLSHLHQPLLESAVSALSVLEADPRKRRCSSTISGVGAQGHLHSPCFLHLGSSSIVTGPAEVSACPDSEDAFVLSSQR